MTYLDLINQNIGNVYQAGIATKILQHMGRIRNNSDMNQARRWGMELLQNARDVAWPDLPVKVKMELSEDELRFSHTGRPFRIKDILSIVNQVSSKVDDENTVGQFGTGFVTTFQLSELVELKGVLKEVVEGDELPYKPFHICIDRQGFTKDEVLTGIEQSMSVLQSVDEAEELADYVRDDFNTTFIYSLKNDRSRNIARIGMDDLRETIFYVLLFSQKIGSVELQYKIQGDERTICYTQGECRGIGKNLYVADFWKMENNAEKQKVQICFTTKDGMTMAVNYSDENGFEPLSEGCARLFIDFPLIGAEKFCFPVVINDMRFRPNEPRSGISLVDNELSMDARTNKALMDQAVALYKEFLADALELTITGINNIIAIPCYEASKEWSEVWVKEHIYQELYTYISSLDMFDTVLGKMSLNRSEMFLLNGSRLKEREALKPLLQVIKGICFPVDTVDWYQIFAAYDVPERKVLSLERLLNNVQNIFRNVECLDTSQMSIVKWCERIFRLAMENEVFSRRIRAGEIAIFPSQKLENGKVWYLRTIHEVRLDPGIPEILKDVTELLDRLEPFYEHLSTEPCNIRMNLLHKEFEIDNLPELILYEWSKLGSYIEVKSNEGFRIKNYQTYPSYYKEIRMKTWILMVACGPDSEMYDLISQFWEGDIISYEAYQTPLGVGIWRNSYHGLLRLCIDEITGCFKVESLRWYQSVKCPDIYKWLNLFYKKWMYYQYNNEDNGLAIYLNQDGHFKKKILIERDCIKAKELKTVAYGLREQSDLCNYYKRLLHEKIELADLTLKECRDRDVALLINQVVTQLLMQQNLSDASIEQQEACSLLLTWIQSNPDIAEQYFPAYSNEEGQMKLLTPKAAVRMQQKVHKLEQMIALLGCPDEAAALEMIQKLAEKQKAAEDNRTYEFMGGDVILDADLYGELSGTHDEESFQRICREIGIAGEKYVLSVVKEYYLQQNLETVTETEEEIKLQSVSGEADRKVTISYPDNAVYHQAGWDICIEDSDKGAEKEYIEVKTHTAKSRFKNRVKLSNEQMKMAIAERTHYHVLVAMYDYYNRKGQEILVYDGFLKHVANGKLRNMQDGYVFHVE